MTQRAVIFDINGTLWGTSSPEKRAMKEFNIEYNDELHSKVQRAVCGAIFTDWLSYLSGFASSLGIEDNPDNRDRLKNINLSELERATTETPKGIFEVLNGLKNKYYKLAAISNCYPPTENFLEKIGIKDYMDLLFLSYQNGITKQNPEIYQRVLDQLKVSPENAVMVGDNLYDDIIQSKKATNKKIGGIWIDLQKQSTRTQGYDFFIVSNLAQVPEAVEEYFK